MQKTIENLNTLYGMLETYKAHVMCNLIASNRQLGAGDQYESDRYLYQSKLFGAKYNDTLKAIETIEKMEVL